MRHKASLASLEKVNWALAISNEDTLHTQSLKQLHLEGGREGGGGRDGGREGWGERGIEGGMEINLREEDNVWEINGTCAWWSFAQQELYYTIPWFEAQNLQLLPGFPCQWISLSSKTYQPMRRE